ncbi:MAG: hypothetical protein Q9217_005183, partial [Psora testacea]
MEDHRERNESHLKISIPSLDEALHQSEASSPTVASTQGIHTIAHNTIIPKPEEASLHSEVSSIIPTSARLSIATTHQSVNIQSNSANITETLESILNSPGWNVATQAAAVHRRNSLMSTRSLQTTLPSYEDHQYHLPVRDEAGPSSARPHVPARLEVSDPKTRHDNDVREHSPRTPEDPENALSAHYSRIVRTIDSRYTSELERLRQEIAQLKQAHVKEVALMRNSMDAAYRSVLKKRDQEVEKAKEEAVLRVEGLEQDLRRGNERHERELEKVRREAVEVVEIVRRKAAQGIERLEEEHKREAERGRHVVEDEWERRWLGRMRLCDEEATRMEERGRRNRDEEWVKVLGARYPQLVHEVKDLMLRGIHSIEG